VLLVWLEDEERLFTQLGESRPPASATAYRPVVLHGADHVDLLTVVDLIPQRLQNLSKRRPFGVTPIHQARNVRKADVAGEQLLVIEDADSAVTVDFVTIEREVHFLDVVTFSTGAKIRLRAWRSAPDHDAVAWFHGTGSYLGGPDSGLRRGV